MTSKERITIAMKCGKPDRVPVTLGLSEIIPVKYYGNDYIQFHIKDKIQLWKARVELEHDKFGGDAFLHLAPGPSPHDPEKTTAVIKETRDEIYYRETYHTNQGDLSAEFLIGRQNPVSSVTHFINNPEADFPKVAELLKNPDTLALDEVKAAYTEIGDRGHVGLWLSTPIDWWSSLRGVQNMVMDLMLLPDFMSDVFKIYTEYMIAVTDYTLRNSTFDSVGLGWFDDFNECDFTGSASVFFAGFRQSGLSSRASFCHSGAIPYVRKIPRGSADYRRNGR